MSEALAPTSPSPFTPVRKRRVYEDVLLQLQRLIEVERFRAGDKLPPERELAGMLGVNRTSLRQALQALSLLRLVEIRPGDGVYVRDFRRDGSPEALYLKELLGETLDPRLMLEALEARRLLESHLAALAAEHAGEEDLRALDATLDRMAAAHAAADPSFIELDWEFHLQVSRMSGRSLLPQLLSSFYALLRGKAFPLFVEGAKEHFSIEEHRAIADALRRRDPEAARRAVEAHVQGVEGYLDREGA